MVLHDVGVLSASPDIKHAPTGHIQSVGKTAPRSSRSVELAHAQCVLSCKHRGVRRGRRVAMAVAVGMLCLSPPVLQHWIMYHAFRRVTRAVGKGPSFKILAVAKVDGRFERCV